MNATITSIEPVRYQAANEDVLEVRYDIRDEAGNLVEQKSEAFPLDTPEDVIRDGIRKALETFRQDRELRRKNEAEERRMRSALNVKESLEGATIAED